MDLIKIGAFIAQERKAKGLTQKDLSDKLMVTDRAVSKWECGKGLPDISLMKSLCEILGITLNELLDGERIAEPDRAATAERQIIHLIKERKMSLKKLRILSIVIAAVISALGVSVPAIVNGAVGGDWFVTVALPIAAVGAVFLWAAVFVFFFTRLSWWLKSAVFALLIAVGHMIIDPLAEYLIGGEFILFRGVTNIVIISCFAAAAAAITLVYFLIIKRGKTSKKK